MSAMMMVFLAGLTALAFIVVALRRTQTSKGLRGIALLVAAAIVVYVGWLFVSALR